MSALGRRRTACFGASTLPSSFEADDLGRKCYSSRLSLSTAFSSHEVQGGRRVGLGRKLSSRSRVACLLASMALLLQVDWVGWVSVFAYVIVVPCLMALLFVKQRAVMRREERMHCRSGKVASVTPLNAPPPPCHERTAPVFAGRRFCSTGPCNSLADAL